MAERALPSTALTALLSAAAPPLAAISGVTVDAALLTLTQEARSDTGSQRLLGLALVPRGTDETAPDALDALVADVERQPPLTRDAVQAESGDLAAAAGGKAVDACPDVTAARSKAELRELLRTNAALRDVVISSSTKQLREVRF